MNTIEENKDLLKFNAEGIEPADMFINARAKAVEAVDKFMEGREEPMYCGFANISIHPARGRFVSIMKKAGIGDSGFVVNLAPVWIRDVWVVVENCTVSRILRIVTVHDE